MLRPSHHLPVVNTQKESSTLELTQELLNQTPDAIRVRGAEQLLIEQIPIKIEHPMERERRHLSQLKERRKSLKK
jgi:hypothetical protein